MKIAFRPLLSIAVAVLIAHLPATALAQLAGIHWAYDQTVFNVTPTESFVLNGTFFNDTASSFTIDYGGAGITHPEGEYYEAIATQPDWGGGVLAGVTLAAGESMSFYFATIAPVTVPVPPGVYHEVIGEDNFHSPLLIGTVLIFPDNTYEVHVTSGISAVPESSTVGIAGGVLCIVLAAFRRQRADSVMS